MSLKGPKEHAGLGCIQSLFLYCTIVPYFPIVLNLVHFIGEVMSFACHKPYGYNPDISKLGPSRNGSLYEKAADNESI